MNKNNYGREYNAKYHNPAPKKQSGCVQCAAGLMVALNFLFFCLSLMIIICCIWILVDRSFYAGVHGNVLMIVATYLLLIGACVLLFITFLGCCGTLRHSYCMILTYSIMLLGTAVLFLIGAILAIIYRTQINIEITVFMRESLRKEYGVNLETPYNRMITQSWDDTQEFLCCCSVEDHSWLVYQESEWYKIQSGIKDAEKPYVPISCCVRNQYKEYKNSQKCQTWELGPPGVSNGDFNEAVYYRGCYEAGKVFVQKYTALLVAFGFGMAVLLILGIVCSVVLLISYRKS